MTAHWGIEDPAAENGSEIEKQRAFATAFHHLKNRIELFCAIPLHRLDRLALRNRLQEIGDIDGATRPSNRTE